MDGTATRLDMKGEESPGDHISDETRTGSTSSPVAAVFFSRSRSPCDCVSRCLPGASSHYSVTHAVDDLSDGDDDAGDSSGSGERHLSAFNVDASEAEAAEAPEEIDIFDGRNPALCFTTHAVMLGLFFAVLQYLILDFDSMRAPNIYVTAVALSVGALVLLPCYQRYRSAHFDFGFPHKRSLNCFSV